MPGTFLQLGLYMGAAAFLLVTFLSWNAGTVPEWAVVRGLMAFGAFAFLGWLAAYIVGTVPPEAAEPEPAPAQQPEEGAAAEGLPLPPAERTDAEGTEDEDESAAA